ncbi:MAG: hypothetical protein WEB06_20735 [Actinomycetota bacterium]
MTAHPDPREAPPRAIADRIHRGVLLGMIGVTLLLMLTLGSPSRGVGGRHAESAAQGSAPAVVAVIPLVGRTSAVLVEHEEVWTLSAHAAERIDPETNQVAFTIPKLDDAGFGGWFALSEDSLWIEEESTTWSTRNGMFRFDRDAGTLTGRLDFGSGYPHGSVWAEGSIWTAALDGRLLRIDTSSGALAGEVRIGAGPLWALAATNQAIWVTSGLEGAVLKVDLESHEIVARSSVVNPIDVAVGEGSVWVASSGAMGYDKSCSCETWASPPAVYRIDPLSGKVLDRIEVASAGPVAVGAGAVWVAGGGNGSGMVSRIDISTGTVTDQIMVGAYLSDVAVGEGVVWVTDNGDGVTSQAGSLIRIDPGSAIA